MTTENTSEATIRERSMENHITIDFDSKQQEEMGEKSKNGSPDKTSGKDDEQTMDNTKNQETGTNNKKTQVDTGMLNNFNAEFFT